LCRPKFSKPHAAKVFNPVGSAIITGSGRLSEGAMGYWKFPEALKQVGFGLKKPGNPPIMLFSGSYEK
jgi:hypothetical protein